MLLANLTYASALRQEQTKRISPRACSSLGSPQIISGKSIRAEVQEILRENPNTKPSELADVLGLDYAKHGHYLSKLRSELKPVRKNLFWLPWVMTPERREKLRRYKPSEETRLRIGYANKGEIPWNKGTVGRLPWLVYDLKFIEALRDCNPFDCYLEHTGLLEHKTYFDSEDFKLKVVELEV